MEKPTTLSNIDMRDIINAHLRQMCVNTFVSTPWDPPKMLNLQDEVDAPVLRAELEAVRRQLEMVSMERDLYRAQLGPLREIADAAEVVVYKPWRPRMLNELERLLRHNKDLLGRVDF